MNERTNECIALHLYLWVRFSTAHVRLIRCRCQLTKCRHSRPILISDLHASPLNTNIDHKRLWIKCKSVIHTSHISASNLYTIIIVNPLSTLLQNTHGSAFEIYMVRRRLFCDENTWNFEHQSLQTPIHSNRMPTANLQKWNAVLNSASNRKVQPNLNNNNSLV